MSDDKDVPPLEDCSEFFAIPSPSSSAHDQICTAETPRNTALQDNRGFAGMKKGFLNKGGSKKKASHDDIPFIKASGPNNTTNLQIPEVQEALKTPLLCSNDWITDDLLQKIEANPKLARQFTNPRMAEALQKFQTDQAAAMKQYQNDREVQEFIQEFCSIMGDHFTKLADASTTKPQSSAAAEASAEEKELLSNKDVQSALLDSEVQKFISLLKTDPENAHKFLSQADVDFKQKVHVLVSKGILAVQ